MEDFWQDSGYRLLRRRDDGHLAVTPDFLRAYFLRPEVRPVEESCPAELVLHESLLQDPERPVTEAEIEGLADPDARDNFGAFTEALANNAYSEAEILAVYMPEEAGEDEIRAAIEELVAAEELAGPAAIGAVMKAMMARFRGRADGSVIPGLYAVGGCASNIAQDGLGYSSGTCIGESTFFGRRAGRQR